MSDYLNVSLLSEAVILDALCNFKFLSSQCSNGSLNLLRLDLILSTVSTFADAFSETFREIFDKYSLKDFSQKEFLNFVVPRGLILCKSKTYFNLILVCGFMSKIVHYCNSSFKCFHFAELTWKCLLEIIKKEFQDLTNTKIGWHELLCYCEKITGIVSSYKLEETNSNISPVNIQLNKPNSLGYEPPIDELKKINTIGSEMNIDDNLILQENSRKDIGNLYQSLDDKSKKIYMESADIEITNASQKLADPPIFKEYESADVTQCVKIKNCNFLYELLTDSSDHLNEILKLIDTCDGDIDLKDFSITEFEFLCNNIQYASAMKVQEKCPEKEPSALALSNLFEASHSECPTLIELENTHSEYCLNELKKFYPRKCCEMCKGKEKYLRNWEKNFMERYPELKQDVYKK